MNDTFLNIALVVVLALFVIYAFRNSRKNKAKQAELKAQIVPGVEVMTNFGLFGTLVSVDEVSNVAEIETSPGNVVRVHRQTLAKVVTESDSTVSGVSATGEPRSVEEAMEIANREAEAREKAANPEFGELAETPATKADDTIVADEVIVVEPTTDATATDEPVKKPVRRASTKKVDE